MDKICWIRAFRLRHRVTIAELAFCAGISSQLLSLIELDSGRQSPQHEAMLRRACAALMSARHAELAQMELSCRPVPISLRWNRGIRMGYETYHIPVNYTDAGNYSDLFEIRNVVEAVLIGLPVLALCARFCRW